MNEYFFSSKSTPRVSLMVLMTNIRFRASSILLPTGTCDLVFEGIIGAVTVGATVAAVVASPRRRYPPPRAGYYVVHSAGESPRAVRAEEVSFIIRRVQITALQQESGGEIFYLIQVTINDGYKYYVLRRYHQFDQLRARVAPIVRVVTAPFPPMFGVRASTVGLQRANIEDRKVMLQTWLQSLCTAASTSYPALRVPMYNFLETALNYPPDLIAVPNTAAATSSELLAGRIHTRKPYPFPRGTTPHTNLAGAGDQRTSRPARQLGPGRTTRSSPPHPGFQPGYETPRTRGRGAGRGRARGGRVEAGATRPNVRNPHQRRQARQPPLSPHVPQVRPTRTYQRNCPN